MSKNSVAGSAPQENSEQSGTPAKRKLVSFVNYLIHYCIWFTCMPSLLIKLKVSELHISLYIYSTRGIKTGLRIIIKNY